MCNCKKNIPSANPGKAQKTSTSPNLSSPVNNWQTRKSTSQNTDLNRLETEMEDASGQTIAEKCIALADMLGLKKAVPEKVLFAAMENSVYAENLFANKNNSEQLNSLISSPPELAQEVTPAVNNSFSNAELISKAGKALFKWGFSGFTTVSAETLKKREDACLGCTNLIQASRIIQRFSASARVTHEIGKRTGNKTCAVCGCVVKNKMRLATDTCPEENPATPGLNRWGEPMQE